MDTASRTARLRPKTAFAAFVLLLLSAAVVASTVDANPPAKRPAIVWLDHYGLLPGGAEVTTSYESTSSGVGGGLTALVVHSSSLGDTFGDGGNKVVHMAASAPPRSVVTGVRVCYELTSQASHITQVRLAQVQDPPATALVLLDDGTDLTSVGPVCVDSASTSIDAAKGPLLLSLRLDYGDLADRIAVRGVGLHLLTPP